MLYTKALEDLEDDTYKSWQLPRRPMARAKSSLGHRKKGWQPRQEAHQEQQIFSPASEKAVVRWVLKLGDFGFSPRVDILMGLVKHLAKNESAAGGGAGFCGGLKHHRQELDRTISEQTPYLFY